MSIGTNQERITQNNTKIDNITTIANNLPDIQQIINVDNATVSGTTLILNNTSDLPYIPLEYIESTGTQYIDTNFIPNQDTRLILDFIFTGSSNAWLFGSRVSASSSSYACLSIMEANYFRDDYGTYGGGTTYSGGLNNRHLLDKNKNITYMDSSLYANHDYEIFTCPSTLALFTLHLQNGQYDTGISKMKLFSCRLYDNGLFIRDYIPVKRKSDNEICLYDKVTETFFTNQGTGTFIAGPEIN